MLNHGRRLRFDAIKACEGMLMQYHTLVIKAIRGMLSASPCPGHLSSNLSTSGSPT
jgi:hypothetical protein